MKPIRLLCALVALFAFPSFANPDQPKIQIAILLDTSSSMDGLINQTRQQLWKIVNTFATAQREGKKAKVELALYEYGNDSLNPKANWIRQVSPLTGNLDKVSEQLFALRTNGGEEYCGAVITQAVKELEWSKEKGDLKLIYIAGNEPFTQGPIDYHGAVKTAIGQGIVVNTIHAGDEATGIAGKWKDAALLADGNYMAIDQNRAVAQVKAPQDEELAKLGEQLNGTYIGYGREGAASAARQSAQDSNARGLSTATAATRAVSKSSSAYDNADWDLVDAKKENKVDVKNMAPAALPAPMKAMAPEERVKYVEEKSKERADIQAKISTLNAEREKYVQSEMKKQASAGGPKTMDSALLESAHTQAAKANFKME